MTEICGLCGFRNISNTFNLYFVVLLLNDFFGVCMFNYTFLWEWVRFNPNKNLIPIINFLLHHFLSYV